MDLAVYSNAPLMVDFKFPQMLPVLHRTFGQRIEVGLKCKPRKWEIFPESIFYLEKVACKAKMRPIKPTSRIANGATDGREPRWRRSSGNSTSSRLIPHSASDALPIYKQISELRVL